MGCLNGFFGLVGCEEVEIQVARTDCRQILFGQSHCPRHSYSCLISA